MYDSLESRTIELLRFPLIVLVIAIHAIGLNSEQIASYGDWGKIYNIFFVGTTRVAVPCFFLISGYLFFYNPHGTYTTKIRKRLRTLVIPYFIWNAPWVFFCIKNNLSDHFLTSLLSGLGLYPFYTGNTFEPKVPWDVPLWYVRDLFCICLVSPVIKYFVQRRVVGLLFIASLSILLCMQCVPCPTFFSISGVLFFAMGAYWSIHKLQIRHISQNTPLLTTLFVAWIITLYLDVSQTILPEYSKPWHGIQIILGAFVFFGLAGRLSERGITISKELTSSVFFLYCFHYFICLYITIPVRRMLAPEGCLLLIYYALAVTFIVAISLTTYYAMKKYLPKLLSLLTSGR